MSLSRRRDTSKCQIRKTDSGSPESTCRCSKNTVGELVSVSLSKLRSKAISGEGCPGAGLRLRRKPGDFPHCSIQRRPRRWHWIKRARSSPLGQLVVGSLFSQSRGLHQCCRRIKSFADPFFNAVWIRTVFKFNRNGSLDLQVCDLLEIRWEINNTSARW